MSNSSVQRGQTVDRFAQVCTATSQMDAGIRRVQHTLNARTTLVRRAGCIYGGRSNTDHKSILGRRSVGFGENGHPADFQEKQKKGRGPDAAAKSEIAGVFPLTSHH